VYNAGEALTVPARVIHAVRNVGTGTGTGTALATDVVEKGKPLLTQEVIMSGTAETSPEIRPFRVDIAEEQLTDLRRRIAATRWPGKETVADQSQGAQLAKVQELVRYWGNGYDWRKFEARLNALPQFVTNLDGLDIHFIHIRSRHENALPLIMTHGWPGSIAELLKTIGPLTDSGAAPERPEIRPEGFTGARFEGSCLVRSWQVTVAMTPVTPWAWSWPVAAADGTCGAHPGLSWPHRGGDLDQPGGQVNAHAQPSDRDAVKRRPTSANPGRLRDRVTSLTDRRTERDMLERLVDTVRAGESAALVVHGDPGVGKTALLDHLAKRASGSGCQVARATGVQSEMELAFAGLHQLCAPMLNRAERLPEPQRDALRTAFGLAAGPPPDRFLVGLAVLSLLSGAAGERPLICLIDDEQWLDRASAQALGFTARRLAADPVGLVFAARDPGAELAGLPELDVGGLRDDDARVLLDSALAGPLDERVRDLIVAETRGNPLALLELPRGLTPAELAGGFGLLGAAPLTGRIEESFRRQLDALPDQTRRLLQLAAADPSGDRALVFRAARRLDIPVQAGVLAAEAGLAEFGGQVRFRHPLARSAVYRSASLADRQQMHAALAEVTDPRADPDRRAWHRAEAADGPDEEVAAELERSAGRAQARGGLAAAAAFLDRSALLTDDPARHAERALAAAQASMQAAAFGKALELLTAAESGPLDDFASARVDLLRGLIAFASMGGDAPSLLLKAAKRLEPLNLGLARETYLNAWRAASFGGSMAGDGDMLKVSRAARALPPPADPARPIDFILDGLARLVTDGPAAAGPALRRAVNVFVTEDVPREEGLWSGWMAATVLWEPMRRARS